MEQFIKENWFKLSIVAILLIIGLSAVHYFSIYLPDRHNSEYSFQQAEKCKSLSDVFVKEHIVKPEDGISFLIDSQSHFNRRLNACLFYYNQRIHLSELLENYYVVDVLTGNVLIEMHLRNNKEFLGETGVTKEGGLTLSVFADQKQKLMSE